ncbi:Sodium/calcium exchanger protein [Gigaspora rosea]|uniref:Vacuolar calcium ion transporter n=1 Tax=Gigaspora rosea TaxID=44941 RepID=A0A397V8Z1_9GLOM|nr:Sodium/calcium exchanger protein [Gigaspora rosea]
MNNSRLSQFSKTPTFSSSIKTLLKSSSVNLFLIFVPFGIVSKFAIWSDTTIFFLNFLALIPLTWLLYYVTKEISLNAASSVEWWLCNVFGNFGNLVEFITYTLMLHDGLVSVVQASIFGSILSDLLSVYGYSCFHGGSFYKEMKFNIFAGQTYTSFLMLIVSVIIIPTAYSATIINSDERTELDISRKMSIILLFIYIIYIYFRSQNHNKYYKGQSKAKSKTTLYVTIPVLILLTTIVTICANSLSKSIVGLAESWNISTKFIGLILIPNVGNASDYLNSIAHVRKNKMELSLDTSIGSSIRITSGIAPILVIIGWLINQPLTLYFEAFDMCMLLFSVWIVNYCLQDGRSNWLQGSMLLSSYAIIGTAIFFYPDKN